MFDRRKLTSDGVGSPIHKFEGHSAAVLCVQVSMLPDYIFRTEVYFFIFYLFWVMFNISNSFVSSGLLTSHQSLEVLQRMEF